MKTDYSYIESIINSIPSAIFTADYNGRIRHFNEFTHSMLGYDRDEFSQLDLKEIFVKWDYIISRLRENQSIVQEDTEVNLRANKNEVNLSVYPITDPYGSSSEMVFVLKDVKKVRRLANKVTGSLALYTFDKIIGHSPSFIQTVEFAKKIADSRSTVLILGESGTGKEVFAQSIQNYSNRKNEPFVALNCGAIPKNLIESELFGYVGGAFTGAKTEGHPGKFEIADGGTLFLDEIGEMTYELQTRLLRVIEEGVVRRIGGNREIPVDVRVIAATNKNLKEEVDKGNFRKDLYYRLNVLPLRLPPLRERPEDIPLLMEYFMDRKSKRLNKKKVFIPEEYMEFLMEYEWPGNIRELENLVELIINTETIPYGMTFDKGIVKNPEQERHLTLTEMEALHITKTLENLKFNITRTSEALGIGRNTLYRKIKEYGIRVPK
ncbi:MAG: sigma 54-interacting transcriptional regulator [Gudongella sp.]|jgi:PAS domain S-box-containing protein|nr:sigma 54-interacting transcriptional regulator [Gudongella sp.]